MFHKKGVILQGSQENTYAGVFFLIKLQVSAWNFIKKETLAQMFFHVSFPNSFKKNLRTPSFTEHLRWLLLMFY